METRLNKKILYFLIGISTIIVHFLHILSDLMELVSGFSHFQLILTYVSFVFIPIVILGLCSVQWQTGGWSGLIGSLLYAISFIYFSSTAIFAINSIKNGNSNYEMIYNELGFVYIFHGGLMVFGGIMFGYSVIHAKVLPHITGFLLIIGLIINAVVSFLPITPAFQIIGSIVRNIGLMGMGIAILYKIKTGKINS